MLSSLTVNDFVKNLAADDMPPGGGSTAALAGLLAVGLLEMSASYSLKSPKLVDNAMFLAAKQAELARLHVELTLLIDRDALALRALLAAAGLPASTTAAAQVRNIAVQKALKQAAEVPLETARACLETMEIANSMLAKVETMVVSDLLAGVMSAYAGVIGALLGTTINLSELAAESLVKTLQAELSLIRKAAEELKGKMENEVYQRSEFSAMRLES